MDALHTARLTLMPYTPQLIRSAIAGRAELERLLAVTVPRDWPSPDYAWFLPFIVQRLSRDPSRGVWDRLIIHTRDRVLIGHVGLKGGPDAQGSVDLGYSLVPAYRGQGFATEAGTALIDWAFLQPGVTMVKATCHRENRPSIRVLERLGFRRKGELGSDLLWELERDRAGT